MRTRGALPVLLLAAAAATAHGDPPEADPLAGLSCLLEPNTTVELSSQEPGIISRALVQRGDAVRRGQTVVTLESGVERTLVQLARARLEFARRKAERNEELFRQDLLSPHERDEMETEARMAALELKEREERLALRTIRSPIDGFVVERSGSPGEYIGEEPIMTIVSIDPLHVEVIAPVSLLGRITTGMTAEVRPDVVGGAYPAEVVIVDPVVDPTSDTFGVRLALDNDDGALPAGLKCEVRFLEAPPGG